MAEQDQQFVEYVLKAIVDNPDDVQVDRTIDEMGVLISVTVNPDDMGKVIGKSGQTAKAVRTLLKVVGAKNDARVNMKIIEPEGGSGPQPQQGTTAATDDAPVQEATTAEATQEAVSEQASTDAAVPQPSENDEAVDEATGDPVPEEPVAAESDSSESSEPENTEQPSQERKDPLADVRERSALDDLI